DGAERRLNLLMSRHTEALRRLTEIRDVVTTLVAGETDRGSLEDEVARSVAGAVAAANASAEGKQAAGRPGPEARHASGPLQADGLPGQGQAGPGRPAGPGGQAGPAGPAQAAQVAGHRPVPAAAQPQQGPAQPQPGPAQHGNGNGRQGPDTLRAARPSDSDDTANGIPVAGE
ncbi:MAG TPA: hypothetical protein VEL03_14200, partial [Streptosporangiaceae bacterium]|nr:hypothetical protein [Streptosporangiaceae bacterium]